MYMFENPFSYVANPSRSQAVGLAKMYFGLPDLDPSVEANQVQVYVVQPCGCAEPYLAIAQPVRTSAGGVPVYNGTPVQLALDVDVYSLSIKSSSDAHIYYTPRVLRPDSELRQDLAANNSTVLISGVEAGDFARRYNESVSVKDFGAVGDGVSDDRAAIQAAFDHAQQTGTPVFFPPAIAHYAIRSTHPDYPNHGLVLKGFSPQSDYKLYGCSYRSMVMLETPTNITSLLYCPDVLNHTHMSDLWFNANFKADYVLKANEAFMPFLQMDTCDFRYAVEANVWLTTYLAVLNRVTTQRSKVGFKIEGSGSGPVTSMVLNSCYALMARDIGFDFGYATYCTLNSCAVDGKTNDPATHTAVAYSFASAYGVTMNACGSEGAKRYLKVQSYRGLQVNTPFMLSAGGLTGETVDYLIELVSGIDATISGLRVETVLPGGYNYKLGVTGSSFGGENVTVLDNSIFRTEAYFVPNFRFERPIKFLRGDESNKSETFNISDATALLNRLSGFNNYNVSDNLTIQLADGTYDLNSTLSRIKALRGSGSLTIQGNASNRASVKLQSDFNTLQFTDCSLKIVFKNLTVGGSTSNSSNRRMQLINCPNVVLDNVDISRDGLTTGNAILLSSGSKVILLNGSIATGPFAGASFNADSSSEVIIAPATTFPATGAWVAGNKLFNSAPTAGGNVGWVYTATGWKTFGTIGA